MRSLSRLPALAVALALCSACAAKAPQRASCEPVPAEFELLGQTVYRDCEVERKARSMTTPRLQYTPSAGQRCLRAVVDVVVDSTGRPLSGTARVVRATDPGFASAVVTSLEGARYQPAMKDGRPVPQLVRVDQAMSLRVVVPAATPAAAARTPRRSPPC